MGSHQFSSTRSLIDKAVPRSGTVVAGAEHREGDEADELRIPEDLLLEFLSYQSREMRDFL